MRLHPLVCAGIILGCVGSAHSQTPPPAPGAAYGLSAESREQPGVPKGEVLHFSIDGGPMYPGTTQPVTVYVPAEYTPDKPACLYVCMDGDAFHAATVFDNLIIEKEMPVTIGIFVGPGTVQQPATKQPVRFDRCYQFDSVNDNYVNFLTGTVIPKVETMKTADGRALRISPDPNDHAIAGASSGAICAFTAAWERPDAFRRVFTAIGTFVGMRGGDRYPTLIRKTEPKPLRIYLQDGEKDTWNPLFGNWYTNNRMMEESLSWAGYAVEHQWGTGGHSGEQATSIFPDVMRWLWKDWPRQVTAATSPNSMQQSILAPGSGWEPVGDTYAAPAGLAANVDGIVYFHDSNSIYDVGDDGKVAGFAHPEAPIASEAVGHDGWLYAAEPGAGRVVGFGPRGRFHIVAEGLPGVQGITTTDNGDIFVSQPGAHDDQSSTIQRLHGAEKSMVDSGLRGAAGLAFTADHNLFFAVEGHSHWIYSYVVQADGSLTDKQRFYWLHTPESDDDTGEGSGASDLATDVQGNLYVATAMGVQVCDRNGRVEAILPLPGNRVTSLCFGGRTFDTLYVAAGNRIYKRKMKTCGVPSWSAPVALPPFGAG